MYLYNEIFDASGRILEKEWNYCHSSGFQGQVLERFYPNGNLISRVFRRNGVWTSPFNDSPALVSFHPNGEKLAVVFVDNGVVHRPVENGPARENWYDNGNLCSRRYVEHGKDIKMPLTVREYDLVRPRY